MRAARGQDGFTLIEALVALAIVAMVVITFLGIRTKALADTMEARNWRLAREIAEEQLSVLQAGAHETLPQSGTEISLADKYAEHWCYKIMIGDAAVSQGETEIAELTAPTDDSTITDRNEWQRGRRDYRKASALGMSLRDYEDHLYDEEQQRLEDTVPAEDEFVEIAVIVYFPKVNPLHEGDLDALMIKARVSSLALSGLTPEQARIMAESRGEATATSPSTAGPAPGTGAEGGN